MVTDLLFEIEFDKFHFEEIHNNPPKGIFKPPKKRRENYSGINFSSNNSINCNSCFDDELDDLLAKREPDFYDFILSYMHSKHIDTEPELYKKAEVDRKVFAKIRSMRKFKVYLRVDINEAAKRAFNDINRKSTEKFETIEEQKKDLELRYKLENERYFNLYNVHKDDMNNYDLVIDTTTLKPEEVAEEIINKYNDWLKK